MLWIFIALSLTPLGFLLLLLLRRWSSKTVADLQMQTIRLLIAMSAAYAFLHLYLAKLWASEQLLSAWLFSTLLSFASAYCLFHIVNMAITSRRIQLLIEQQSRTTRSNQPVYDSTSMIDQRLRRLERQGHIAFVQGSYQSRGGILYWAAWFVNQWRKIIFPEKRRDS